MKKISWLSLALLASTTFFVACQKNIGTSTEIEGGRNVTPRANAVPTITFSSNPAIVGVPVTLSMEFGTCGNGQLQVFDTQINDWVQLVGNTSALATSPDFTFSFTPDSIGTCAYKFRMLTGGGPGCAAYTGPSADFCLEVIDPCTIEGNEFSGDAISCATEGRTAEYTFGSEDGVEYFKMQGGLNNFTGDNATVYVNDELVVFDETSADGWAQGTTASGFIVGQRTPGGSSNRNIRVEGSLAECTDVVVKIVWSSSNSGGTITGEWSVKDAGGIDLATPLADLSCD
jgi:hypothetical protein